MYLVIEDLLIEKGVVRTGTLIFAEGKLTPACSKSHIKYTFNLPVQSRRLNIDFEYQPKKLFDEERSKMLIQEGLRRFCENPDENELNSWKSYMPLSNLLTISIDDPKGFRGSVHRHTPVQHLFITEDAASPGLIQGSLPEGQWSVTISVHAVVTEECCYKLHVWEGDD